MWTPIDASDRARCAALVSTVKPSSSSSPMVMTSTVVERLSLCEALTANWSLRGRCGEDVPEASQVEHERVEREHHRRRHHDRADGPVEQCEAAPRAIVPLARRGERLREEPEIRRALPDELETRLPFRRADRRDDNAAPRGHLTEHRHEQL